MNGLAARLLGALALLIGCVLLGLWLHAQQLRLQLAGAERDSARQAAGTAQAELRQLQQVLDQQRAAQRQLQTTQHDLRRELDLRRRRLQELEDENRDLKAWAAQPLPAAARRLRQRPTLDGASAYRDWLSTGDALPATGHGAAQ